MCQCLDNVMNAKSTLNSALSMTRDPSDSVKNRRHLPSLRASTHTVAALKALHLPGTGDSTKDERYLRQDMMQVHSQKCLLSTTSLQVAFHPFFFSLRFLTSIAVICTERHRRDAVVPSCWKTNSLETTSTFAVVIRQRVYYLP